MIYGAIVAWIALLIIAKVPVPGLGTVWPAIVVGVTVFFLVIVASTDLLSCVPANVYGYAALVGYTLSAGRLDALTAADNSNPLFLIVISAIVWSALFRPGIVARHHFTTAVAKGDGSVRVFGHQGSKQPTSNTQPTLRNGAWCLRSHVAFGDVGGSGPYQRWNARLVLRFIAQDCAMPM